MHPACSMGTSIIVRRVRQSMPGAYCTAHANSVMNHGALLTEYGEFRLNHVTSPLRVPPINAAQSSILWKEQNAIVPSRAYFWISASADQSPSSLPIV